jgi:hypothetical protein
MTLFTTEFLDKLWKEYEGTPEIIDQVMTADKVSFHDAIILLAKRKGMEHEYFKKGDKPHSLSAEALDFLFKMAS